MLVGEIGTLTCGLNELLLTRMARSVIVIPMKTSLDATNFGLGFSKQMFAKYFCVFLCLLGTLALTTQANAGVLYASSATGAAGELYIIDAANGAMIQDIGPLNDTNAVNYPITGLAFHPITGVLYGSTGNNPETTAARLVTINPATGLVTLIGSFNAGPTNSSGVPCTMADIAFDSAGNLYGAGSIGGPQLYSINLTNAKATVIGTTGLTSTTGGGLAISSSGVFYGTPTASRYGTYDTTTGAFTAISTAMVKPVGGAYGALVFDENGVLYALNVGSGSPPPTHIVTIALATGVITDLGASLASLDAIAFQPTPRPKLSIANAGGNQVTLSWLDASGFQLEYRTNLSTGVWLTNTTPPVLSGGTNSLTLSNDTFATFFRLRKP